MDDKLEILDSQILDMINYKKAKPNKTIKEHTVDLLKQLELLLSLGYIEEGKIYELVEKACIYHDIGKLNSEFQNRIEKNSRFDPSREIVHNILSLYFIDKTKFDNEEDYLKVAHSVINHHDYCNVFEEIIEKKEIIKSLIQPLNHQNVKRSTINKLSKIIDNKDSIKIKGYLHKCDYNASAGNVSEHKNDFLDRSLDNLLNKWRKEDKNASWNKLQLFCKENKNENIIAIAQTGMGKTEAGLHWIGNTKGFFILPLRTAINAIYDRIKDNILDDDKRNINKKLSILHSNSLEYYISTLNKNMEEKENIDIIDYEETGKRLSIPLNISTMDQLFDFVYKYKGYELKLTTLSYSKIVIDEIQMYGPDLLAYLIYGIERIVDQGGKVAILTATLPPFVKDLLKVHINFKESKEPFTNNIKRHNLKVINEKINCEDIYEKFIENKKLGKNNKILVVCNTIKKAQELYNQLNNLLDKEELNLLHSKFINKDRLEKENEIIKIGKTYDDNGEIDKQNTIWISTSIVEASLDIDFDYLFTELQDLNSLFQRLGRCNRKGKKDSSKYNCYIYTDIDESTLINGKKGFIDKTLYKLSKEAILSVDGQITEVEKLNLINNYLTSENLSNSDYMISYREIYNFIKIIPPYEFDSNEIDLRNILSEEIIPSPVYMDNLGEIQELQEKLKDKSIDKYQRIQLKDKIRKYSMSVHPNDVRNYQRGVRNKTATTYNKIRLSDYEYIKVIECEYGEMGYKKMDYKTSVRPSNIF